MQDMYLACRTRKKVGVVVATTKATMDF